MRYGYALIIAVFFFMACASPVYKHPHVVIKTTAGNIEIEVYPDKAPKTVTAFLFYIDAGYYKKGSFYRILNDENQASNAPKAELIQGGIWKTNNKKAISLPGIPHETTQQTGILHKDGVISMARLEPGTATTEFFICVGDQPGFDFDGENSPDKQGYAAFGKVTTGMDIVKKIYNRPETDQAFDPPIIIIDIVRL